MWIWGEAKRTSPLRDQRDAVIGYRYRRGRVDVGKRGGGGGGSGGPAQASEEDRTGHARES